MADEHATRADHIVESLHSVINELNDGGVLQEVL